MKIVKSLNCVLKRYLQCPNVHNFGEDFQGILQTFYLFGFYQPTGSTKGLIYGVVMFLALVLTCIFGSLEYAVKACYAGDVVLSLTSGLVISYMVSLGIQIASFGFNQNRVIGMIKEFHLMHEAEDEKVIQTFQKKCSVMTKGYNVLLQVTGLSYVVFKFFGVNPYKLFIPVIYDDLENGFLYYILSCANLVQLACLTTLFAACDLFHIICIVRAEANLTILFRKLQHCTDNSDMGNNERNLIFCMRYHYSIIA